MAGPYPGYGPQAASVAAYEPSWFERLIAALATDKSAPEVDAPSGVEYPAGVSAKPLLELSGLAGAARLTANVRAGHPVTNINAPSYAGQYGDVLDTVGLAAPAVALGMKGLAKGAGAVADSFVANSGARARQRGAIRAGGDERLIPSHATDLEGLERARDRLGPNMLYSPSIGINLNKVNRFKDQNSEGTIFLIPKIGAFDPATYASVLYNRDAYLPRHSAYALNQWGGGKTGENLAFDKGLANVRLIGGEGKQIPKANPESIQMSWSNTAGHKAALANSPHFRSFAQYEASPAGMATLVEGPKQLVKDAVEPLYNSYRSEIREAARDFKIPFQSSQEEARLSAIYRPLLYGNRAERIAILEGLKQSAGPQAADIFAHISAKYRQRFSRVPAEYAELQPQGLTPLTEENWAGAMVAGKDAGMQARGLLKNLPVEWFEPGTLTADHMKRFQGEYGLARRQPIGQKLQLSAADRDPPKTPAPYLTGLAGTHKWPQKGTQNTFQPPKGKPDAWAYTGIPVDKNLKELLEGNFTGELDAQQHLNYVAEQLPLVKGAEKADYEASLVATMALMKQKGWKPDAMAHQFLAGLDEVFPAAKPKVGKPPVWVPDGDWIPDDHMVELQKFAGQANDTDLQQALFDYASLHPDEIADYTPAFQDAFAKVQAAFAKVPKPWKSWEELAAAPKPTKTTFGDWKAASAQAKAALPPAPVGTSHSAGINPEFIQEFLTTAKSKATPADMVKYLQDEVQYGKDMAAFLTAEGKTDMAANWASHGASATAALEQFDTLIPNPASKAKKPLTSTGDAALDAEIDALAKSFIEDSPAAKKFMGEAPTPTPDDWLDVSPTGIPWKNVAGSFESLLEEVATPGVLPEQGVADFVDLFKEAGGKVIKGKNAGGQHTFLFEGTNGKDYMASLDELANDSEHFEVILKQLLPQVWSHVKKASK